MIHHICVGVALERPPRIDEFRSYALEAATPLEARELALLIACHGAVMPVWDGLEEDVPFLPNAWLR